MTGLDLKPFVHPLNVKSDKNYVYNLTGVVNHEGSLYGGHYYAFCQGKDNWFRYDDSTISPLPSNPNDVNSIVVNQKAYLLFYTRSDVVEKN